MHDNIHKVRHEPPVTPGEKHSMEDTTLFQVAWYSHDRMIGFLGRKNFDNMTDMIEYLLEFNPKEKWKKNGYGYYQLFYNSGYNYMDRFSAAAANVIRGLVYKYKEFQEEVREENVRRSVKTLKDSDFGRVTGS